MRPPLTAQGSTKTPSFVGKPASEPALVRVEEPGIIAVLAEHEGSATARLKLASSASVQTFSLDVDDAC